MSVLIMVLLTIQFYNRSIVCVINRKFNHMWLFALQGTWPLESLPVSMADT